MSTAVLSFRIAGLDRIATELEQRFARTEENKAALMDRYGMWMMETTSELSPYDTGFMSSHVTYTPLDKGWHDFEVGWYDKDFRMAGLEFYPVYQEFGTIHHPAQPSLGPAWRALSPHLKEDAAAMLRRSMGDPL